MEKHIQAKETAEKSYIRISSDQLHISALSNIHRAVPPWFTVSATLKWDRETNTPIAGNTLTVSVPKEITNSLRQLVVSEYLGMAPMERILNRLNASWSIPNTSHSQKELMENMHVSLISPVLNILIHDHKGIIDPNGIKHPLEINFLWEEELGKPGNMIANTHAPDIKIFKREDSLPEGYIECITDYSMLANIASKFNIQIDTQESVIALNTHYDKNKSLQISVRDPKGIFELSENDKQIAHPVTVNFEWNPFTKTSSNVRVSESIITPSSPLLPGTQIASMRFDELLDITSQYGITSMSLPIRVKVGGKDEKISREVGLYDTKSVTSWDLFISHTSETRTDIAEPLASELENRGAVVWFDEWEILAGDKITRKIEEGIKNSPVAVVLISKDFIKKSMALQELESFQVAGKTIIPVLCRVTIEQFLKEYPLLRNNRAIEFEDVIRCANQIIKSLEKQNITNLDPSKNRQQRRAWERQLAKSKLI